MLEIANGEVEGSGEEFVVGGRHDEGLCGMVGCQIIDNLIVVARTASGERTCELGKSWERGRQKKGLTSKSPCHHHHCWTDWHRARRLNRCCARHWHSYWRCCCWSRRAPSAPTWHPRHRGPEAREWGCPVSRWWRCRCRCYHSRCHCRCPSCQHCHCHLVHYLNRERERKREKAGEILSNLIFRSNLRFSSLSGGVLLLLWCLIVLKSAGVTCGDALRACNCKSGLLLLLWLEGSPLPSTLRSRLRACDSSALLRLNKAMRLSTSLLICCSCGGGGGGGDAPAPGRLLNNVAAPSSCICPWCGCGCELCGARTPALAKFCICARCCRWGGSGWGSPKSDLSKCLVLTLCVSSACCCVSPETRSTSAVFKKDCSDFWCTFTSPW